MWDLLSFVSGVVCGRRSGIEGSFAIFWGFETLNGPFLFVRREAFYFSSGEVVHDRR